MAINPSQYHKICGKYSLNYFMYVLEKMATWMEDLALSTSLKSPLHSRTLFQEILREHVRWAQICKKLTYN